MRHATEPLQTGDKIAGYEIIREIGHGGFGIVYEAYNPVTRDRAAIKQFIPRGLGLYLSYFRPGFNNSRATTQSGLVWLSGMAICSSSDGMSCQAL